LPGLPCGKDATTRWASRTVGKRVGAPCFMVTFTLPEEPGRKPLRHGKSQPPEAGPSRKWPQRPLCAPPPQT